MDTSKVVLPSIRRQSSRSQQVSLKLLDLLDEEPSQEDDKPSFVRHESTPSSVLRPHALLQSISEKKSSPQRAGASIALTTKQNAAILKTFSVFMRAASSSEGSHRVISDGKTTDGGQESMIHRTPSLSDHADTSETARQTYQTLLDCDAKSLVYALTLKADEELAECLPALEHVTSRTRERIANAAGNRDRSMELRMVLRFAPRVVLLGRARVEGVTSGSITDCMKQFLGMVDVKCSVANVEGVLGALVELHRMGWKSLSALSVCQAKLGNQQIKQVGLVLQQYSSLSQVNLSRTSLGQQGMSQIVDSLSHMSRIDVASFLLAENNIGSAGLQTLSTVLGRFSSLRVLNLSFNSIGDTHFKDFCDKLASCRLLERLQLQGNMLGARGAGELGAALNSFRYLKYLDLSYNSMQSRGMERFCRRLTRSGLEELRLNVNQLEAQGMRSLSKLLTACASLSTLTLRSNDIRDQGARAICEALLLPNKLQTLDLSQNNIGEEGAGGLLERTTGGRVRLDLSGHDLSDKLQRSLQSCGHRV